MLPPSQHCPPTLLERTDRCLFARYIFDSLFLFLPTLSVQKLLFITPVSCFAGRPSVRLGRLLHEWWPSPWLRLLLLVTGPLEHTSGCLERRRQIVDALFSYCCDLVRILARSGSHEKNTSRLQSFGMIDFLTWQVVAAVFSVIVLFPLEPDLRGRGDSL